MGRKLLECYNCIFEFMILELMPMMLYDAEANKHESTYYFQSFSMNSGGKEIICRIVLYFGDNQTIRTRVRM